MIAVNPAEELTFKRPFTAIVKEYITITNKNSLAPIAFKVKTTAPKLYCVRPNTGKLLPGQSTQVQVLLQQMQSDPPLDVKCKDKFLIQAIKINQEVMETDGEELTAKLLVLWQQAEELKKSQPDYLDEIKLRCVYLPEDLVVDDIAGNAAFVGFGNAGENEKAGENGKIGENGKACESEKAGESGFGTEEPLRPTTAPIRARTLSKANSALISPLFTLSETEISDLKLTIKRLTDKCADYKQEVDRQTTLRSRPQTTNAGPEKPREEYLNRHVQLEGVPSQTVALMCFLAFLFGVLFF